MIRPLGDWILRTALAEAGLFASRGGARVGVAVNVSLLQLHDRAFVDTVTAALKDCGFAPHELTLEIAETAFVDDLRLVADVVAELSALGVRLAIDHFGVGTAGLVALKSLPIDEIKIDRSFIAGAATDAFDATIVAGLIEMAHNLGKTVTADGVEHVDQIAALAGMRCDAIQGYFIGEPLPADGLVGVAALWRRTRGASGATGR
jgi:EAL domain-containing protein (putative c-di-GMP-specific phosphodiesterase class I)